VGREKKRCYLEDSHISPARPSGKSRAKVKGGGPQKQWLETVTTEFSFFELLQTYNLEKIILVVFAAMDLNFD
jgi:hypothetical protein